MITIRTGINSSGWFSFLSHYNMFPLLIVASCLLALAKSAPQTFGVPKLDGRIVGGQPTSIEDYPYQASLFISDEYTCAAVIISEEYVVTVASCTYG